jgi:hypothetical protein
MVIQRGLVGWWLRPQHGTQRAASTRGRLPAKPSRRATTAHRASHDDYTESVFPTGSPVGTCEDALDTACGLDLGDPTAWT